MLDAAGMKDMLSGTAKFDANGEATFIAQVDNEETIASSTLKYDIGNLVGNTTLSLISSSITENTTINLLDSAGSGDTLPVEVARVRMNNGVVDVETYFDNDNATLKNAGLIKVYYTNIKLTLNMYIDPSNILGAQCGTIYGSYNAKDRLFVANGNVDYHTLDDNTGKPNYTYFGTDTYCAIGNSSSKIIGYNTLNDGSLAIYKDKNDVSNIYIREAKINNTTETYEVYDYALQKTTTYTYTKSEEIYPTFSTGLLIDTITENTKIVQYDNKVIFNTKDGIYYLSLNNTTSNQTYAAKELSYNIRNDLGENIDNSSMVVYKNKLYVARENTEGQLRIYVADKNRYTFIDGEAQYHWWVLDNIPAYKLYVQNDELYFADGYVVYKFIDKQLFDYIEKHTESVTIGGTTFDTELMFNTDNETLIISPTSNTWKELTEIWKYNAAVEKNDKGAIFNHLKDYLTFVLNNDIYMELQDVIDEPYIVQDADTPYAFMNVWINQSEQNKIDFYNHLVENQTEIKFKEGQLTFKGNIVSKSDWIGESQYVDEAFEQYNNLAYIDNQIRIILLVNIDTITANDNTLIEYDYLINIKNEEIKIKDMQTLDGYLLSESMFDLNDGEYGTWKTKTLGETIGEGNTTNYNILTFEMLGVDVNFYNIDDAMALTNTMSTTLKLKAPIKSMWCSGYNDFGRIDVLKTTRRLHFVPEIRRGGYTHVGYRSSKKAKDYNSDSISTMKKLYYSLYLSYTSNDFGLNFDDIEFDDFSFEGEYFARTYSATKKIKNFSYIQLKLYSDDFRDSTIGNIAIKYFYGKNSRDVK